MGVNIGAANEPVELKEKVRGHDLKDFIGQHVAVSIDEGGNRSMPVSGILDALDEFGFVYLRSGSDDSPTLRAYNVAKIVSIEEVKPVVNAKEQLSIAQQGQENIDNQKKEQKETREEMFKRKGIKML